jgi:hypothetical protein
MLQQRKELGVNEKAHGFGSAADEENRGGAPVTETLR